MNNTEFIDTLGFRIVLSAPPRRYRTRDAAYVPQTISPVDPALLLERSRQGVKLFPGRPNPERPGKFQPAMAGDWRTVATADSAQLFQWFGEGYPVFGMPTGGINGRNVLDRDQKSGKDGRATMQRLGIILPFDVTTQATPNGGAHYYFAHDSNKKSISDTGDGKNGLGPGLDRRGDGGFVWDWELNGFARTGAAGVLYPSPDFMYSTPRTDAPGDPKAPIGLTIDEVREALRGREGQFGDRTAWTKLCAALKHEFGDAGYPLFDEISAKAPGYVNAKDTRYTWDSFKSGDEPDALTMRGILAEYVPADVRERLYDAVRGRRAGFGQGVAVPPPPPTTASSAPVPTAAMQAAQNGEPPPWGEPQPIEVKLVPAPSFDADAMLPEVLASYVMDEARRMNAPPEMIAAASIVTLGSLIGTSAGLCPKANDPWIVLANLWGAIVGDPSVKKTPAQAVSQKPLADLIKRAREEFKKRQSDAEFDEKVLKIQHKAIDEKLKKAAVDPAANLLELRAEYAEVEAKLAQVSAGSERRFVVNDATIEALGILLASSPRGLLVLNDEIVSLIASFEREGHQQDRSFFLTAFNGTQSHTVDRVTRGKIEIERLCLSVFGSIQPDILRAFLIRYVESLANDGFLARLQVMVYPDRCAPAYVDEQPTEGLLERVMKVYTHIGTVDPILGLGAMAPTAAIGFPHFRFDAQAQARFAQWYVEHERCVQTEDRALLQQHFGKYDKLVAGLALIFHYVEHAQGRARSRQDAPGSGRVGLGCLERAIAWAAFLEAHARRIYGLLFDDGAGDAVKLAEKITDGALRSAFAVREVVKKGWSGLADPERVQDAIDKLVDAGWLREIPGSSTPRGGRPGASKYEINPKTGKTGKTIGEHGSAGFAGAIG